MSKPMDNKTPEMKAAIESIFPGTAAAIEQKKCPLCRSSIDPDKFRDPVSLREYMISGMCQGCQDDLWGVSE